MEVTSELLDLVVMQSEHTMSYISLKNWRLVFLFPKLLSNIIAMIEGKWKREGTNWYWVYLAKADPEIMKMLLT